MTHLPPGPQLPQVLPAARPARPVRAGVLGAVALVADVSDKLVLATARDVHGAVAQRVRRLAGRFGVPPAGLPWRAHDALTGAVYGGVGSGLRGASAALRAVDGRGVGAPVEAWPQGRAAVAAANGFLGDRLREEHPRLAITMSVRRDGVDVPTDAAALREAFPDATGSVVVFVHGLGHSDESWTSRSEGGYAARLAAECDWTPVLLRANTGLPVVENGVALTALLDELVAAWPTEVHRIALVGHSMGGLIIRSACAVVSEAPTRWNRLVTDVVTLGTPHLGAPLERTVHLGARALGLLPESAPFGRILEHRSLGILDLRAGLAADLQHLPHARYRLVAATLAGSRRHPVSEVLGDLLVRYPSATGRPRRERELFPGAEVLHVRGSHLSLLDHPEVYAALRRWLS